MPRLAQSFTSSLRNLAFGAALALAALAAPGLGGSSAEAAVAGPALGAVATTVPAAAPITENVRWVCGPWRCVWRPNYNYWYVPPYARAWGQPVAPNCFWRRGYGWGSPWVHVCP